MERVWVISIAVCYLFHMRLQTENDTLQFKLLLVLSFVVVVFIGLFLHCYQPECCVAK